MCGLSFYFINSFKDQKIKMKSTSSTFLVYERAFSNLCLTQVTKIFSFYSRSYIAIEFTFKSKIWAKFLYDLWGMGWDSYFCHGCLIVSASFIQNIILSPLNGICIFIKNHLAPFQQTMLEQLNMPRQIIIIIIEYEPHILQNINSKWITNSNIEFKTIEFCEKT